MTTYAEMRTFIDEQGITRITENQDPYYDSFSQLLYGTLLAADPIVTHEGTVVVHEGNVVTQGVI